MNEREKAIEKSLRKTVADLLEFCYSKNSLYLYGAGAAAGELIALLSEYEIKICGTIVENKGAASLNYCCDKIYSINEYVYKEGDGIVLAVREGIHQDVTIKLLNNMVPYDSIFSQKLFYPLISGIVGGFSSGELTITNTSNGVFFDDYNALDLLGEKYNTDKHSRFHNYLKKYEFFLERYRDQEFTLLELGVFRGGSVKTWAEYFSKARVVGVDIDEDCIQYGGGNIEILIKNVSNWNDLHSLKSIEPTIIVDDASHRCSDMIKALFSLFPVLPSGGVYIVEDLSTSFSGHIESQYMDAVVSTYEVLEAIQEIFTGEFSMSYSLAINEKLVLFENEIYSIASQLDMISFIHGSCILIKR